MAKRTEWVQDQQLKVCAYFPPQHSVETRRALWFFHCRIQYHGRNTYHTCPMWISEFKIHQLVPVTGQYSGSLFHGCHSSASLESNLVTRGHTYSALFLLWDHTQCRWFCICCITEISQQFPSNNVIFSGKSIRLIMKQGEISKQRQLGEEKKHFVRLWVSRNVSAEFREQWLHNSNRSWF